MTTNNQGYTPQQETGTPATDSATSDANNGNDNRRRNNNTSRRQQTTIQLTNHKKYESSIAEVGAILALKHEKLDKNSNTKCS